MCSTPFGIIGILTAFTRATVYQNESAQRLSASSEFSRGNNIRGSAALVVLNAFRHHRNSHEKVYALCERINLCSTPFGIIGILTTQSARLSGPHQCAQRL